MKKTLALLTMIALVSSLGTAFAEDTAGAPDRSGGLYNGATYFDLGSASTAGEFVAPLTREAAAAPYNGITVFELGQTGSNAQGSCAVKTSSMMLAKKPYNGITIF